MKRAIPLLLSLFIFVGVLSGCGETETVKQEDPAPSIQNEIGYADLSGSLNAAQQEEVNGLFYENNFDTDGADPACIYCNADGYFYMYTTGFSSVVCHRSRDLNHWEYLGYSFYNKNHSGCNYNSYKNVINPKTGNKLTEAEFNEYKNNTWVSAYYIWAPGVIYDDNLGLYLMYFTARYTTVDPYKLQICLAVSKTPFGPFLQWTGTVTGGTYENGRTFNSYNITYSTPFIDFERLNGIDGNYPYEGYIKVIDVEPFVDPATGDKYLYMCRDLGGGNYTTSSIMGMKMIDWFTPDYSTLTLLTEGKKKRAGDHETMLINDEGDVNEGPFCIYNAETGKYILTYSCNGYLDRTYRVKQAIGDTPLGPFTKLEQSEGSWLMSAEPSWPQRAGTGHHCFVTVGNELFMVYHMHYRPEEFRSDGGIYGRRIAVDKVLWKKNCNGDTVMAINGPSVDYRLCPRNFNGGYSNLAEKATVTVSTKGNNLNAINDGLIKYHAKTIAEDYHVRTDSLKVTLNFKQKINAKSILVYNTYDINYAFEKIERIEIDFVNGEGKKERAIIGEVAFDWNKYYTNNINKSNNKSVYSVGCASGVLFGELSNIYRISVYLVRQETNKITGLSVKEVGLSDIQVIGKY